MLAVVVILAAETSALTTLPLKLNPAAFKLPAITLPLEDTDAPEITPTDMTLPAVALPVTFNALMMLPVKLKLPVLMLPD